MPAVRCSSRIDTFEMKLQIGKRLGSQKADKYFNLLTRYLDRKLKKPDFENLLLSLIGRENLHLHNELIISIVKNASLSNSPPQKHTKTNTTPLTLKLPNGSHPRTSLQSLCAFPQSPKKGRTPNLRKVKTKNLQQQIISLPKPNSVEEGYIRSPVKAPFGVNIHSSNSKETRKVLNNVSDSSYLMETCHYSGELPSSNFLKNRLKHNLEKEGLDIDMDCVNLLNNGLDSFLKRVIKPSLELTRSTSSQSTSMLDFRVATEMDPKILGECSRILHENF